MKGNQLLDSILKVYQQADDNNSNTIEQLRSQNFPLVPQKYFMSAIRKLYKDGYLEFLHDRTDHVINEHDIMKLSFSGVVLIESGGYAVKAKRESISASLQSWQTWAIAVGTVLAGLYGLYEMIHRILRACNCG